MTDEEIKGIRRMIWDERKREMPVPQFMPHKGPIADWEERLIHAGATAAGTKAYQSGLAQGREEMGKEIVAFVERHCKLSMGVTPYDIKQWLKESG